MSTLPWGCAACHAGYYGEDAADGCCGSESGAYHRDGPVRVDTWDWHVDAECPYCDRAERFEDEWAARAWLVGHIQMEHDDALPSYEGTGG